MSYDPRVYKANSALPVATYPVTPQNATVPFWDVPPLNLEPSEFNFSPWDIVTFAGQVFPGMARVKSKKARRFDGKHVRGQDGSTQTGVGYKPAEIDVVLSIWTSDQLNLLQKLMPILLSKPGATGKLKALDVYHPALDLIGVNRVIVFDVDALEPSQPKGVWSMKIHCTEWYPPPKTQETKTATGSLVANTAITPNPASEIPKPSSSLDAVGTQIGFFR